MPLAAERTRQNIMAAKKSKTASKNVTAKNVAKKTPAGKATAKKAAVKKVVAKSTTAKKSAARKSSVVTKTSGTKKTAAKSSAAKSRSKATSVDGILKRYQKERVAKDSTLVAVRAKIKDLTGKIQAFQKEIVKLKAQQLDTENSICTLDIRRDQEVAGLLSSLGINLDSIASAADAAGKKKVDKPTPLFDGAQSADDKSADGDAGKDKPQVEILIAGKD